MLDDTLIPVGRRKQRVLEKISDELETRDLRQTLLHAFPNPLSILVSHELEAPAEPDEIRENAIKGGQKVASKMEKPDPLRHVPHKIEPKG